jgi:colanic acid biosynthesis protein WcaH
MGVYIPDDLYAQILSHVPIACVDLAIVSNGCVLLVQRKDPPAQGQWWIPGGRVYKGEMMKDAARRKAQEEVGIACHVGPMIHTAETIFPDGPFAIPIHSINSCFLLYPVEDVSRVRVRLDEHHEDWQWANTIPAGLHPYVARCLQAAGLD